MDKKNVFVFSAALAVAVFDQLTKYIVRHNFQLSESVPVIKNVFHLTYVTNTGSAFSMFQGVNIVFIFISIGIIGGIIYYLKNVKNSEKPKQFALGSLLGGAVGNLIDRLFFGRVIDFLDFRVWPVFNIADSAITVSILLLAFLLWRE